MFFFLGGGGGGGGASHCVTADLVRHTQMGPPNFFTAAISLDCKSTQLCCDVVTNNVQHAGLLS